MRSLLRYCVLMIREMRVFSRLLAAGSSVAAVSISVVVLIVFISWKFNSSSAGVNDVARKQLVQEVAMGGGAIFSLVLIILYSSKYLGVEATDAKKTGEALSFIYHRSDASLRKLENRIKELESRLTIQPPTPKNPMEKQSEEDSTDQLNLKHVEIDALGENSTRKTFEPLSNLEYLSLLERMAELESRLTTQSPPQIDPKEEESKEYIKREIVAELERRSSAELESERKLADIRMAFMDSNSRLSLALSGLYRRGNLNLIIGITTTVFAAMLLVYMALSAPAAPSQAQILNYYIPRVSTVVFVEVFAFFFLRLYKFSLAEDRFYQIELTNISALDIALQAAFKTGDQATITAVINHLALYRKQDNNTSEAVKSLDKGSDKGSQMDIRAVVELMEKFAKVAVDASKAKA